MKIALLQFDIAWENKSGNLMKVESLVSLCPGGTDLIILPEMFNTGFSMNPAELAEKSESETFFPDEGAGRKKQCCNLRQLYRGRERELFQPLDFYFS